MRHFDHLIIGAGSGNSVIGPEHDDWDIAVAEHGAVGCTCLNVGCIPSKMFVYAAEVASLAADSQRLGINTSFNGVNWLSVRDRIFGRIDPIAAGGLSYRQGLPNVTVYTDTARFVGHRRVAVGDETVTAERIVVAAGAHTAIPEIEGIQECGYHTSDTVMRLDALPQRLLVIGGGYIAAELGSVFGAFSSQVTFILRGDTFLRPEDDDIRQRFTAAYEQRFDVRFNTRVLQAQRQNGEIILTVESDGGRSQLRGDELLIAAGRQPNTRNLNVAAGEIELDQAGYIVTNDELRTSAEGVWALGDVTNPVQLKHVANHEARVVRHNLTTPDNPVHTDHRFIPHAVFGHPQVASVGLTERKCQQRSVPYRCHVQPYAAAAYGWAMEDTDSAVKVIAHAETRKLVGAHIIGPQASTLIQQLIQGMHFDLTVDQMAREQYYIHPALTEVVEQALLELSNRPGLSATPECLH